MKKLIILIIVNCSLLIPSTRDCYSQFTWQKTYRSPVVNGDDEAFDGCFADGSNFYAVGSAALGPPYLFVLKVDQFGDTVWTRTFDDGRLLSVTPSGDYGCVFTGLRGSPFSIKMSSAGNIIWDLTYNNSEAHDITITNDSGFILCAGIFTGYVCKIDTAGNLQWERNYTGVPLELYTVELAIDGGYILGGRKYVSGNWNAYLLKIDGAGNILWEKTYVYEGSVKAIAKKDNGYVFISSVYVSPALRTVTLKTDIAGNLLLADTLLNNSLWDSYPSIVGINNNKFIVSFHSDIPMTPIKGSRIISIDSNLQVINELLLRPDTNSLNVYKVIKAPGSTIDDILCIGSAEPNSLGDLDVYIARIDSSLNIPPPISVTNLSNEIPGSFELFQNYPNPFNPTTNIKFSIPERSLVTVKIYNILGSEIKTLIYADMPAGNYSAQWNASGTASGIYFVVMQSGAVKLTKKMALLK
jgi:hypothetical protein